MLAKLLSLTVTGIAVLIGWQLYSLSIPPPIPPIKKIYRINGVTDEKVNIQPFKVNISNQVLDDLKRRLSTAREFTPPLKEVGFEYGFNTVYLKKIVDFWKTKYDWRVREKYLNSMPQFKIEIGSLKIHYIHVKPAKTNLKVIPILLLHGWPGSVREFYELIPLLTTPQPNKGFLFEVIAPSLPGYGFSDIPKEKGYDTTVFAAIMLELMTKLNIQKFYVQGGDWGAIIASQMATLYPSAILGLHSNMCHASTPLSNLKYFLGSFWPSLIADENEIDLNYPITNYLYNILEETGYLHLQATKPDTVGVALNDSPVGLAAYILEKFSVWTNRKNKHNAEGNLEEKFRLTDLLDNIMIYWVTGTITSSMRLYAEAFPLTSISHIIERHPVIVPTACVRSKEDLVFQPITLLKEKFVNLTKITDIQRGGHFLAMEEPRLLADDIYKSVFKIEDKYYN